MLQNRLIRAPVTNSQEQNMPETIQHRLRMDNLKPMTVRLPEAIHKEITAEIKRSGLSKNAVVHLWLANQIEQRKKPELHPWALIDTNQVVMYDRLTDRLVFVTLEEDEDETIHLVCEEDMGDQCDHAKFVAKIPKVKRWIAEAKQEAKY